MWILHGCAVPDFVKETDIYHRLLKIKMSTAIFLDFSRFFFNYSNSGYFVTACSLEAGGFVEFAV